MNGYDFFGNHVVLVFEVHFFLQVKEKIAIIVVGAMVAETATKVITVLVIQAAEEVVQAEEQAVEAIEATAAARITGARAAVVATWKKRTRWNVFPVLSFGWEG